MGELICKKHKKEQKRVPTNFIFDQMLTYRDPEDNRLRIAISIFQKRTKETRFNITVRCLRLREEKEDGSAVLEWDGGNISLATSTTVLSGLDFCAKCDFCVKGWVRGICMWRILWFWCFLMI